MKILLVGATSNIGYSVAKKLAIADNDVYIGVHKGNEIDSLNNKIKLDNLKIKVCKLDVEDIQDRKIMYSINPDCLFVHVGVGYGGSIFEMDIDILRKNYEINVFSNFSLIKEFYNLKKNSKNKSKIFITSSISSYFALPFLGCYSSTKASISNLCKAMKYELKYLNSNISITLIEPGAYHTGFNQVMIDNIEKYAYNDSKILKNICKINRIYRNLFALIEKDDYSDLVNKIVKEINRKNSKFRIRRPIIQSIFLKIYLFIFG